jgi:undecaprenyl-diphosphatase
MISLLQIIILGLIQGAAELLPISSSAHVIVAEKLMGIDPTSPQATFLLVMLHTGTMFAVLVYFWRAWRESYFSSRERFCTSLTRIVIASAATGAVYLVLKHLIVHRLSTPGHPAEVEELFGRLPLIAAGLATVGLFILVSARKDPAEAQPDAGDISLTSALGIGLAQGACLPIRGLSRSGLTISTALIHGVGRRQAEEFSFALAVVLTPAAVAVELHRLLKAHVGTSAVHLSLPGLFGMLCSFLAGLAALRLLSRWLEAGKWRYFGYYCLAAALVVLALWKAGL